MPRPSILSAGLRRSGRLTASALLAFVLAGPGMAAADDGSSGPAVTRFTLENGMEGVVIEDHRAPVVTHMVWYRVGAADEAQGKSGIAHFLEHLLFKGTDDIASGEFSKIIAANGGQDNAFTSLDYTAYYQRIARDRLELVMKMEADRMRDLELTEKDVVTERDVVIEERSSRTDNDPGALFREQMNAALYLNHPYGIPVVGWRSEIDALNLEDAVSFYERFYAPNNAILVVAGDVTPAEVEALAKKHYGPVEPTDARPQPRPQEPPQLAERRLTMEDARVRQPYLSRSYLVPSYLTGEPGEGAALAVMAEILGGGLTAPLSRDLVLDQKIALNAGSWYSGVARDDTSFGVYAVPVDGMSLDDLEAQVDATIARLKDEGPTDEELARAKTVLVSSAIYSQDSQAAMARQYGAALTIGHTVEDVKRWPADIEAVDAEAVRKAVASLRREASVTGYLLKADDEAVQKADAGKTTEGAAQ